MIKTKVNFSISSTFSFFYEDDTYICVRCGQTKNLEGKIGKQPLFHWFISKLYGWRILRKEYVVTWKVTGKKICDWPFPAPMIHDVCGGGRIVPSGGFRKLDGDLYTIYLSKSNFIKNPGFTSWSNTSSEGFIK